MILDGSNGVTFNDASLQGAAASPYVLKNRIINGAMVIDQRNAGASGTGTNNYTVDRWTYYATQSGKITWQQNAGSVTPPIGFNYYMGFTSSSAYSIAAGDVFVFEQRIEGYNMADLSWGTANAKTITLSFWVRSSLTGTFGGAIQNSANDRSYVFSYTISAANTWEQKSVTITGCTDGTWLTTNGIGARIYMGFAAGSTYTAAAGSWLSGVDRYGVTGQTNIVGTNGATWYITGVQLEQNTSATPFERRLYNQELANCQRYYWVAQSGAYVPLTCGSIFNNQTTTMLALITFPVPMRTSGTLISTTGTNIYAFTRNGTVDYFNSFSQDMSSTTFTDLYNSTEISGTAGQSGMCYGVDATCKVAFSAEL
jgi:hypothetical protein